jgi:hypothetical protein
MSTEGIELLGLQNLQLKDSSGILALTAVSSIVVNFEVLFFYSNHIFLIHYQFRVWSEKNV